MSLQTTKEGISIATKTLSEGNIKPILILSTSRPVLWKKEAEIKKAMILEAGLSLDDVIIIPNMMDSFEEAEKIKRSSLTAVMWLVSLWWLKSGTLLGFLLL